VRMAVSANLQGLSGLIHLGLQAAERGTDVAGASPCARPGGRPPVWEDVMPPPLVTARSKPVGLGLAFRRGLQAPGRLGGRRGSPPPLVGDAVVTCSHGFSPGRRCPTLLQRCRPGRWVETFAPPWRVPWRTCGPNGHRPSRSRRRRAPEALVPSGDLALTESVDDWPLATIILDALGGTPVYQ